MKRDLRAYKLSNKHLSDIFENIIFLHEMSSHERNSKFSEFIRETMTTFGIEFPEAMKMSEDIILFEIAYRWFFNKERNESNT